MQTNIVTFLNSSLLDITCKNEKLNYVNDIIVHAQTNNGKNMYVIDVGSGPETRQPLGVA